MQKLIISLICCLLPTLALSDTLKLREDAPDRYVVTKGDTLWDISAKFFTDPWKWPEIWGLNKETIKNPHWIYPGDVVVLNRAAKTLKVEGAPLAAATAAVPEKAPETAPGKTPETVPGKAVPPEEPERPGAEKLHPRIRVFAGEHDAIPTIPLSDIEPFLKRNVILEKENFDKGPIIVSGFEGHTLLANDDIAFVKRLPTDQGVSWQVFRPGKPLTDIDSGKVLGYEARYLGDARVEKFGDVSVLRIIDSKEEIFIGDRLVRAASGYPSNFVPHAPDSVISARIISTISGVSMTGSKSVVVINKGQRDDIQIGHVLALYRKGEAPTNAATGERVKLPNMRYGLLLIFRTFDNVSYGLVMEAQHPVELADIAQTP